MISKSTKFFLLLALIFQFYSAAMAGYDVINAKTVENNNIPEEKKVIEDYLPTYNDDDAVDKSDENTLSSYIEKKYRNFKLRKARKNSSSENEEISSEEPVNDAPANVYNYKEPAEIIDEKNKFAINADKITYDEQEGNIYAKGNVEIIAKAQNVILKADDAVLDKNSQTIKLSNNVKIIKDGTEMLGEFMLVDLNEQNILMDNPTIEAYQFTINAQEGYLITNDIQMINGTIQSEKDSEIVLETRAFQKYENVAMDRRMRRNIDRSNISSQTKQTYEIDAKEVVLTSYKDHNSILLKKANVYFNKHKIMPRSDIEILSDKQYQRIETNALEAGAIRNFGAYVGYGYLFRLPRGQILKLMPVITYGDSNFGIGGVVRHRSRNHFMEAGWSTSAENLVVNGRYNFGRGVSLQYGRNAYMREGFMGARRAGYAAQLKFERSYLNEDLDAVFNHGVYAGIFSDYQKHRQEHAYATTRFRYNMELRKQFYKYHNQEQDLDFVISAMAQGSASVYGSGETMGVGRIGPFVTTKLKRWESSIGYMFGGIHGDSPFKFDKYRYGKSSIMLNEKFNFNNILAVGYRAIVSPKKDNLENDLMTESRLYAIVGPQDLKFCISYDFVRSIAHLDLMFLLGTDSSKIKFDKLTTKNMDGRNKKKDFYKAEPVKIEVPESI